MPTQDIEVVVVQVPGVTGDPGADGGGVKLTFNSATSGDPGSGKYLFNHATFASATAWHVSETDGDSNNIASVLATIDNGSSTNKSLVVIKEDGSGSYFFFYVTSTLTDAGAYNTFPITPIAAIGSIANGDICRILVSPVGDKGDTGATGPQAPSTSPLTISGTTLTYSTATHDGKALRFTNASGCTVTLNDGEGDGEGFSWYQDNGAGQIIFDTQTGSILHSRDHDRSFGANAVGSCFVNQDQEWVLCGDTE